MFLGPSSYRPNVSRASVHKWRKRCSDGKVSTNDNERVGRPTLTDERALMSVRET